MARRDFHGPGNSQPHTASAASWHSPPIRIYSDTVSVLPSDCCVNTQQTPSGHPSAARTRTASPKQHDHSERCGSPASTMPPLARRDHPGHAYRLKCPKMTIQGFLLESLGKKTGFPHAPRPMPHVSAAVIHPVKSASQARIASISRGEDAAQSRHRRDRWGFYEGVSNDNLPG